MTLCFYFLETLLHSNTGTRTSKARTNRSTTGELDVINESRRDAFRTPARRSQTYRDPDERPIVSSGKYRLPLPESPQQRRRLRKHTIREEGKEEDTSELTSKLDDDDDDSPLRMSDSPSLPKIGRKKAVRIDRKRTVSEVESLDNTSEGYSSDSDFEGTATMLMRPL